MNRSWDRSRRNRAVGALCACIIAFANESLAFSSDSADIYQISLTDLMQMEVTSASKKEQTLAQVAAALFVIGQDDIKRSGALNIPDLLRMVPGLSVAQINANTWAISARGFNTQFADKLLVLIDGRTVFTPTQDGVNWDVQDVPLEDIERIEIIRGPGATVWGANAVNGVINIITKQAADTQGASLTAGGGGVTQEFGTLQYGGSLPGGADYRVFAKYLNEKNMPDITGQYAADGWNLLHGGFRLDKTFSAMDSMTAQGDVYGGSEGAVIAHIVSISPPVNDFEVRRSDLSGGNLLGRWNHASSEASDSSLQIYFDRYFRGGPESFEGRDTIDVDFHNQLKLTQRQDLVWGAEYRRTSDQIVGTIDQAYLVQNLTLQLYSLFFQDQISWEKVAVYVGSKLERTDLAPFEAEPSVRLVFTPTPRETWWAAISQAARTPARRDVDSDINLGAFSQVNGSPALTTLFGNPQEKSEDMISFELGYRTQLTEWASLDISTYYDKYRDLRSVEPGAPVNETVPVAYVDYPLVYGNLLHGITDGIELSAKIEVADWWSLIPAYTLLHMDLHTDPGSRDTTSVASAEGSSPRHQAQLRSAMSPSRDIDWNLSVAYVGQLHAQQIPAYVRLDSNIIWRPTPRVELSLAGQNLLHAHHLESNDVFTSVNPSQLDRSAYARAIWKF